MNLGAANTALSGVGRVSNFGISASNTSDFVATRTSLGLNNGYNGLYGSYSGYGQNYSSLYGLGGRGGPGIGYGAGFNNTGFLIAAVLMPAVATFVNAIVTGLCNCDNSSTRGETNSKFDKSNSFNSYSNEYDSEGLSENFDNNINIGSFDQI